MCNTTLTTIIFLLNIWSFEACSDMGIVSRSSWKARMPKTSVTLKAPVEHIFIAHTVTPQCRDKSTCSARMRSMQNYHMDQLGWPDIGYNYVIGGDGRVYEGVGGNRRGTHTRGWNSRSIAISFIGDYSDISPNTNMLDITKQLIICANKTQIVSASYSLHGARDGTCTVSPGNALYNIIQTWPRFVGGPLEGYTCGWRPLKKIFLLDVDV